MEYYSILDLALLPLYMGVILGWAYWYQRRKIRNNPAYKYFTWGLLAKMLGALGFCSVYLFHYGGGDTTAYHQSAVCLVNLFLHSPLDFFQVWLGETTSSTYSYFNHETGFPAYWADSYAFFVSRLIMPLELISFKSYLVTSILLAALGYSGIWKLYLMVTSMYPENERYFSWAILFVPSVLFWGSGILKDTWTLAAACWFCYGVYHIVVDKKAILHGIVIIISSSLLMINIKPYVFVALLPGALLWLFWDKLNTIKNIVLRILVAPMLLGGGVILGILIWNGVNGTLGQYSSIDSMVEKAFVTNQDLQREYYQGNSFNLGDFDPTLEGVLSKFPEATIAGLFRPFIWEVKNVVMLISAIENAFILLLTLYVVLINPIRIVKKTLSEPFILFALFFALMFAFSVGISNSNFGALVRLRIPMMPFFLLIIALVIRNTENWKGQNNNIQQ